MNSRSSNDKPPHVTVRVLGPPEVEVGGAQVSGISRKNLALLAYLGVRTGSFVARDTLCGLLWPDSGDDQARASLRQALSGLRKALGEAGDVILTETDSVKLDLDHATTDIAKFLSGSECDVQQDLESTVALYRGDLLEGFGPISPEFDRWLQAERGALQSRYISVLLRLTDIYDAVGQYDDMIATSLKSLSIDPLQEHVHRRLMRAHLRLGRFDAGLKQFELLRETLLSQLGVTPEKPSLDLCQEIRAARGRSQGAKAAPIPASEPPPSQDETHIVAPGRPSIAVLRFKGLPVDGEAAMLGEGLSEDVTIEISREPDLMVVSRQSAFRLDEATLSAKDIGRQLGVRYYLSGSVRVFGSRVRVTAHLVSCETGHEVWSERFDRELDDFFSIQTEIARIVSATAADRIAANVVEIGISRKPEGLESYQLVLKGVKEVHRFTAEAYPVAINLFERAIALTPEYGKAYGWLALAMIYLRWNVLVSAEFDDILPIAKRAVELDPRDPKGHTALGICNFTGGQFDRAEFCFQSALSANPNDELALTEYGRFLMYVDRPEYGLQMIREAQRVNPFSPQWFWHVQGRCLQALGRYDEAIKVFERVNNPPFYAYAYLAACYAKIGDTSNAELARGKLLAARPDFNLAQFKRIFRYKNAATADRLFESFEQAGLS